MSSHRYGEGYSERHPVPSIQAFQEQERQRAQAAAENGSKLARTAADEARPGAPTNDTNGDSAPELPPKDDGTAGKPTGGGQEEKERLKAAAAPKGKPTDFVAQGRRRVTDPVTGGEVIIEDSTKGAQVDPKKLDSRYEGGYSSNLPAADADHSSDKPAPRPAEPSNILLQQFPPPLEAGELGKLEGRFRELAIALAGALAVVWFFTAFGAGWLRFFFRTAVIGSVGIGGWFALNIEYRKLEKSLHDVRMHMHKQRGEEHSPPMPESVEWLNAIIATAWKQISPDIFAAAIDQVEDIMQQSVPGIISEVKISDVGLGTNPFRFVAWRGLADLMSDPKYPRSDWIKTEVVKEGEKGDINDADGDGVADEDESGDFLCLETSFSYSAIPGKRADNIRLLLSFFLNAYDFVRIPVRVWAQIEALSGTIRMRVQMVEQPPYVRLLKVTLMGVPRVEASVVPLSKLLPNVLDLPLISGFVQSAIAAAANEYVAPKSLTLNLAEMLAGGGVKKDVDAIGVLAVQILRGEDLSAQDAGGKSDPYVVLSLARFGRPLYSSRIVFEDLNPNWHETAFILVTKDDVKSDEKLSVQLWDSDARTADDIVGRTQRDVKDLVHGATLNKWQEFSDDLMGFEDADSMQGKIHWRVGFFEKAELNRALVKKKDDGKSKDPKQVADKGDTEKDKEAIEAKEKAEKTTPADTEEEVDALTCPPDPRWPSAILSLTVHNIVGLESREVEKGVKGKEREGSFGQDVDAEGSHLPNGYCELIVNDELIYQTRTKMMNNAPIFEAGTEIFVRDWRKAQVRIAVRDARVRERDPLMGIVSVDVADFFKEGSQGTRLTALSDGVGYGKVSYSMVLKPVKLELPKAGLGWNTATVELLSDIVIEGKDAEWDSKLQRRKISVTTGDDTKRIKLGEGGKITSGGSDDSESGDEDKDEEQVHAVARLPVYDRHSSQLAFTLGGGGFSIAGIGSKTVAVAVASLTDIPDSEEQDLTLDLLHGSNLGTLKRNHIDDWTIRTHKAEVVGKLRVRVRVDPGLDADHEKLAKGSKYNHEFQVWSRVEGMPQTAEENAAIIAAAKAEGRELTRAEKKKIESDREDALHTRQRGSHGYKGVRTAVWAKDGLKARGRAVSMKLRGKKDRDQHVASEA